MTESKKERPQALIYGVTDIADKNKHCTYGLFTADLGMAGEEKK